MPTFKVRPQASGHRKLGTVPSCLGLAFLSSGPICGLCGEVVVVVFRGLRGGERCVVGEWPQHSRGHPSLAPSLGVGRRPCRLLPGVTLVSSSGSSGSGAGPTC